MPSRWGTRKRFPGQVRRLRRNGRCCTLESSSRPALTKTTSVRSKARFTRSGSCSRATSPRSWLHQRTSNGGSSAVLDRLSSEDQAPGFWTARSVDFYMDEELVRTERERAARILLEKTFEELAALEARGVAVDQRIFEALNNARRDILGELALVSM